MHFCMSENEVVCGPRRQLLPTVCFPDAVRCGLLAGLQSTALPEEAVIQFELM